MRTIELSQGYTTQVNDRDYERCMAGRKWCATVRRHEDGTIKRVYAVRNIRKEDGTWTAQYLHCFIMGETGIDHEDGCGLNNQRYNLRPATIKQNGANQKLSAANTSGFKGVTWNKVRKKWQAHITVNGKPIHLGLFDNILDARDAADAGRIKHHKEFAMTNAMLAERSLSKAA